MSVDHAPHHRTAEQLEHGLPHVAAAPHDAGTVDLLVARPAKGERSVLDVATFDVERGLLGDTWPERPSPRSAVGGPDPDAQVTVMGTRAVALVAGARDRWPLAGDQVYVDLDLSVENLPDGTVLELGDEVRLVVTPAPHSGCAQFKERFGIDALRATAAPEGRRLRLRGINTRVLQGGDVHPGDTVVVRRPEVR